LRQADVHIVSAGKTGISNLERAVSEAGIRISDIVINSIASSEAVLDQSEKEIGVV